jgi:hypothetical protein
MAKDNPNIRHKYPLMWACAEIDSINATMEKQQYTINKLISEIQRLQDEKSDKRGVKK